MVNPYESPEIIRAEFATPRRKWYQAHPVLWVLATPALLLIGLLSCLLLLQYFLGTGT